MSAVTNGAELVKRLAASGTPDSKLEAARRLLFETHGTEQRVATSDEVIAALAEKLGGGHATVAKAKQIAETGDYMRGTQPGVSIEDKVLLADAERKAKAAAAGKPADPPKK